MNINEDVVPQRLGQISEPMSSENGSSCSRQCRRKTSPRQQEFLCAAPGHIQHLPAPSCFCAAAWIGVPAFLLAVHFLRLVMWHLWDLCYLYLEVFNLGRVSFPGKVMNMDFSTD